MDYQGWESSVPEAIKGDSLWKMKAYRLALFMARLGWRDATKLMLDKRTLSLSDQLYRAVGSISANLAEGYSRSTGKDRARFYEYALGSARESRDWYYRGQDILGDEVASHRLLLLSQVIRLLLTMVPEQRARSVREQDATYRASPGDVPLEVTLTGEESDDLLRNVPVTDL